MQVMLAVEQWRSGERFVEQLEGRTADHAEAVVAAVGAELRRRLGGAFTVTELVQLYGTGTSWALEIAAREAPEDPDAWESRVTDAAFHRYLRHAQDWGGGRLVTFDEDQQGPPI